MIYIFYAPFEQSYQISIDDLPERHNKVRKIKNLFDSCIDTYRALKKLNITPKENFNNKVACKFSKLNHLDEKSIIFFKLHKYVFGTIHSFNQLSILKKKIIASSKAHP